ncbi:MAG TPA: alpha/beta fold hydrolase [Aggregatilineales bacterium]|nr:alpha/beta fold hydrolase [Anaerolineae bacterium]HUN09514.1 alpha/beta fold hydrolase [Aggregatilineales bacterium]
MSGIYPLLKKPFFGKYQVTWQWPDGIECSPAWEAVTFPSETGATLQGLFRRTTAAERRGTIVCAHPMGKDAKGFFLRYGHAELLLKNGYDVLLFDFNGFGESADGNLDYPLDVAAAGRYATQLTHDPSVGLLGLSFGAAWSLCAVALPGHNFKAVVAEGAFTTLAEYWYRYRVPYTILQTLSVFMPNFARRVKPIDRIREAVTQHILLIYGESDAVAPVAMGQRLHAASHSPSTLWQVPAARHNFAFMTAPDAYAERVLAHFNQHLL